MIRTRAVQTQPKPDNPAKPPDDNSIPARTEGPVGRRRVSVLKNRHRRVKWRVHISKTRATQTRPELQKNLARSGQTQQFLAKKKKQISEKIQFSGENFLDSGKNF